MRIIDPGHQYELTSFDGGEPQKLTFVKRNDPPEKYPGNENAYPGTQTQEVLRALIQRSLYVNNQEPCEETQNVIVRLRRCLYDLEKRHARRHGSDFQTFVGLPIEEHPFCQDCGHIYCFCGESNDNGSK